MSGERSAAHAASVARAQAEQLLRRADDFDAAEESEVLVADRLHDLRRHGFQSLHDRKLPGSNRANVDHLVVGPTGIFAIDAKAWRFVDVRDGSLWNGSVNCDDAVVAIERLAARLDQCLEEIPGVAPVVPVLVFTKTLPSADRLARTHLTDLAGLSALLRERADTDTRLSPRAVEAVAARLMVVLPPAGDDSAPLVDVLPLPRLPEPATPDPQLSLLDVEAEQLARFEEALRLPVEDWMLYLDPEQERLARRSVNGPAAIRGGAGTGKTSVGLHRAVHLASSRPGKLLFITFVRTLAPTFREMCRRLHPRATERIEFMHLHGWALDYLRSRGAACKPDMRRAGNILRTATNHWQHVGGGKGLALPIPYVEDEIAYIKGRSLTAFDEYATLERIGRRTRLSLEQRGRIWELHEDYERRLRDAAVMDADDILSLALRTLVDDPCPPTYAAVVVDEVQDLTLTGLRIVHLLGGEGAPDGLTLIGDGQQSIYAGGMRLSEAGVDTRGRSVVLRRNYRNTAEVLDTAMAVVAGLSFDDLEEDVAGRDLTSMRHGSRPSTLIFPTKEAQDDVALAHVQSLLQHSHVWPGDIAILCPAGDQVDRFVRLLRAASIPAIDLADHEGAPVPQVRVATYHRAKGLEFKHVLLPNVEPSMLQSPAAESLDDAERERAELRRRQLFVAMTRARDSLWISHVVGVQPLPHDR